jgi:hypothetical protein
MEKFETLSKESLFLFSMGCDKPHTLQILRIDREENSLFLVLYDGIVCAGARCDLSLVSYFLGRSEAERAGGLGGWNEMEVRREERSLWMGWVEG